MQLPGTVPLGQFSTPMAQLGMPGGAGGGDAKGGDGGGDCGHSATPRGSKAKQNLASCAMASAM